MNDIITIKNVRGYVDNKKIAYLNLEDVARGLGFTEKKNGIEYVRWRTIEKYLKEFKFSTCVESEMNFATCCENVFSISWESKYIPENIFYKLCFKAKNETARKFQDFVTDEVLPAIRRTGGYIANESSMTDEELIAKALIMVNNKLQDREKQLEEQKPKVLFANSVETSSTSILIGDLAKLLKQNGYDIGQNRLFDWLRKNDYLIKSGERRNMPTQNAMDLGLFEVKERTVNNPDGSIRITKTTKVTRQRTDIFY